MREDIKSVLNERGKGGSTLGRDTARHYRRTSKHKLAIDPEGDKFLHDTKVSRHDHIDLYAEAKYSKINTNPLERYLRSRIGDDWDQVYSDIKAKTKGYWANGYSTNGSIDRLLERFVELSTYMDGERMMCRTYFDRPINIWDCGTAFYVDPRDKTLQPLPAQPSLINRYRRKIEPNKNRYISGNPLVQYHKIRALWYEIKLREPTPDEIERRQFGYYGTAPNINGSRPNNREWFPVEYNQIASSISNSPEGDPHNYRHYSSGGTLWCNCQRDFGPQIYHSKSYYPYSKRQLSTKETRQVLKLIEERDKEE